MEIMIDFILLGSKITVEDDFSHEIKRHLLLGRKAARYFVSAKFIRHFLRDQRIGVFGKVQTRAGITQLSWQLSSR